MRMEKQGFSANNYRLTPLHHSSLQIFISLDLKLNFWPNIKHFKLSFRILYFVL